MLRDVFASTIDEHMPQADMGDFSIEFDETPTPTSPQAPGIGVPQAHQGDTSIEVDDTPIPISPQAPGIGVPQADQGDISIEVNNTPIPTSPRAPGIRDMPVYHLTWSQIVHHWKDGISVDRGHLLSDLVDEVESTNIIDSIVKDKDVLHVCQSNEWCLLT